MPAATVTWKGGGEFQGSTGAGPAIRLNVPDPVAGRPGPSPMEVLLVAVGGCTAVDVVSILQKKRVAITGLEVRVEGERAPDHPRYYTQVHLVYRVTGRQVPLAAVEHAVELSLTKYCSASKSLKAPIDHTIEIVEASEADAAGE